MSIQFGLAGIVQGSSISLDIIGDGTTTTLSVGLEDPPLNLDIKGNLPTAVVQHGNPSPVTATISADGKTLNLMFATPPPASPNDHTFVFLLVFSGQ